MSLWLTQILDPGLLVHNIAMLLVLAAIAMPTIGTARWFALIAGVVGAVGAAVVTSDPGNLFWWALIGLVALVRLVAGRSWRFGHALSKDEELFHQRVVPDLSVGRVRRLLTAGRWREVVAGTVLTRTGERIRELSFVARGMVDIVVDGKRVGSCGPGALVGEAGLSTGDRATADAICATPVRYLGFDATRLYRLLDDHIDLQDAIELAIERSLRDKLMQSNAMAAHRSDAR
jgi:hypothetical protein